jgi:hypothetical protein
VLSKLPRVNLKVILFEHNLTNANAIFQQIIGRVKFYKLPNPIDLLTGIDMLHRQFQIAEGISPREAKIAPPYIEYNGYRLFNSQQKRQYLQCLPQSKLQEYLFETEMRLRETPYDHYLLTCREHLKDFIELLQPES